MWRRFLSLASPQGKLGSLGASPPTAAGVFESCWEQTRGRLLRPPQGESETQAFPAAPGSDNRINPHVPPREAEIQLLERLVWDAIYALQKAGLDSESSRLRRAIERKH